jgi:putative ABC transport system permease protein
MDARAALSEEGRSMRGGRTGRRLLGGLILAETAVTLVLVAGAGLVVQNFTRLQSVSLGFETRGLLTMSLAPGAGYPPGPARAQLVEQIVQQLQAAPGVAAAGVTTVNPIGGGSAITSVISEQGEARSPETVFTINHRLVSPGLLETMGIGLREGRPIASLDRAGSLPVAVVSQRLAERLWPGERALGKRMRLARAGAPWVTVVGVANNVRDSRDPGAPVDTWYVPFDQHATTAYAARFYVMARGASTSADALSLIAPVQQAIWRVDETLAPYRTTSMEAYYAQSIARERLGAQFMLALGAFGLTLAALGVYGVMAFSVAQRTGEIGVRMALGARTSDILPLVIRQGVELSVAGTVIGMIVALWLNRVLLGVLTEVGRMDLRILGGSAVLILLAAFAACLVPAWNAARLDPVRAMQAN